MDTSHDGGDLGHQGDRLTQRQSSYAKASRQGLTLHIFGHQERTAFADIDVVDRNDARIVQMSEEASLGEKTLLRRFREVTPRPLDHDVATEPGMHRTKD